MYPLINYWAVILATASSMVVGAIWYTPKVFGNWWMSLAASSRRATPRAALRPIIVTVIVSFITAWVLAAPPTSPGTSTAAASC